jgi:hypothetical protein
MPCTAKDSSPRAGQRSYCTALRRPLADWPWRSSRRSEAISLSPPNEQCAADARRWPRPTRAHSSLTTRPLGGVAQQTNSGQTVRMTWSMFESTVQDVHRGMRALVRAPALRSLPWRRSLWESVAAQPRSACSLPSPGAGCLTSNRSCCKRCSSGVMTADSESPHSRLFGTGRRKPPPSPERSRAWPSCVVMPSRSRCPTVRSAQSPLTPRKDSSR